MRNNLALCLLLALSLGLPASSTASSQTHRSRLDNGLILLTSEQRGLPIVALELLITAGSRYDPDHYEGVANLTSKLLTYGTRRRAAMQISDELDFIGARLQTRCSREQVTVSLTLLKKDLDGGLQLLADLLTESIFPAEEISRRKKSVIAAIKSRSESARAIARERFRAALFPGTPYGRPVEGNEKTVSAIERSHVIDFFEKFYRPNRSIVAVVGDVSREEIKAKLGRVLKGWKHGPSSPEPAAAVSSAPAAAIQVHREVTQAKIVMGHAGISRGNPDYYAVRVMNHILGGGGLSSRLGRAIRIDRGLAYSVRSSFDAGKVAGTFRVTMQTKNETAAKAVAIATQEIQRMKSNGVGDEELNEAKNFITGSFPLRLDTNRRLARLLARSEFLGLGLDYVDRHSSLIEQVTRVDVTRAARRYLQPNRLTTVMVANLDKANGN